MHPADIKASLEKVGVRQSALARTLKVTQPALYLVIRGRTTSHRIANAISKVTGQPVRDLWPGKYPNLEKQQAREALGGWNAAAPKPSLAAAAAAASAAPIPQPTAKPVPRKRG